MSSTDAATQPDLFCPFLYFLPWFMSEAKWLINLKGNIKTWVSIQRFPSLLSKHKHFTLAKKTKLKTQNHSVRGRHSPPSPPPAAQLPHQKFAFTSREYSKLERGKKFHTKIFMGIIYNQKIINFTHIHCVDCIRSVHSPCEKQQTGWVHRARTPGSGGAPPLPKLSKQSLLKNYKTKDSETSLCKCLLIKQQHTHTLQELKLPGVIHSLRNGMRWGAGDTAQQLRAGIIFAQPRVWFPTPTANGSQLTTPASGDPCLWPQASVGFSTHMHPPTHTHTQMGC